jgi:Protein of unknown function (DUF3617)
MRKPLWVAVICLSASVALAATGTFQPLKVKTGVWQMTEIVTWTGLPPQMAAMMQSGHTTKYKSCVTAKDLNTNPWANGSDEKCKWTVLNSTGTEMEVQGTSCEAGKEYGMTTEVHGKIHVQDSENGTGTMEITLTGNGQTMHGKASYTGKWIGATCPADLN